MKYVKNIIFSKPLSHETHETTVLAQYFYPRAVGMGAEFTWIVVVLRLFTI